MMMIMMLVVIKDDDDDVDGYDNVYVILPLNSSNFAEGSYSS